jgi:hypothetical protein
VTKDWTKWLSTTVNVLLAFSVILGEGISLVRLEMILFWGIRFNSDGAGFLTCNCDLYWCWCSPAGQYHSRRLFAAGLNSEAPQAVKGVSAAQEDLIDIFERVENFFQTPGKLHRGSTKRGDDRHYREDHGRSAEYPGHCDKGDKAGTNE